MKTRTDKYSNRPIIYINIGLVSNASRALIICSQKLNDDHDEEEEVLLPFSLLFLIFDGESSSDSFSNI